MRATLVPRTMGLIKSPAPCPAQGPLRVLTAGPPEAAFLALGLRQQGGQASPSGFWQAHSVCSHTSHSHKYPAFKI